MKTKTDKIENEKIEHKFSKGFNRSSKVLEHKIGINAARLLNTLIYKHNYWLEDERESTFINGKRAFYIIIPNLQVETNLSKDPIQKAIKKLVAENLIEVHKKGIPSKNYYIVNGEAIYKLERDHAKIYEKWGESIYIGAKNDRKRFDSRTKNTPESLCLQQLDVKQPTSELKNGPLVSGFSTVTNNKSTNNKTTNNLTNHLTVDDKNNDLHEFEEELIKLIDDVKDASDDDERPDCNMELFNFLCQIVPKFKGFNISEQDYELLVDITASSLKSEDIALRILDNAKAIMDKRKKSRFGNLFVGLQEIAQNCDLKYS